MLFQSARPLLSQVNYDEIIGEKDAEIKKLAAELAAAAKARDAAQGDLKTTKDRLIQVEADLDDGLARLKKRESERSTLDADNEDLNAQIDALEDKLRDLNRQRVELEGDGKDLDDRLRRATEELAREKAAREALEAEKKANAAKIDEQSSNIDRSNAELAKLRKQVESLEEELQDTAAQLDGEADRAASFGKNSRDQAQSGSGEMLIHFNGVGTRHHATLRGGRAGHHVQGREGVGALEQEGVPREDVCRGGQGDGCRTEEGAAAAHAA